jgi:transposase
VRNRKRMATRSERRVLLVLLTGAPNLSCDPISQAAQVGIGRVCPILARLETEGMAASRPEQFTDRPHRRRFYRLTPAGRVYALSVLGLEDHRG